MNSNTPADIRKPFPTKIVIVLLVSAIIILVSAIGFLIFGKKDPVTLPDSNISGKSLGQLSGTLDINGVVPEGATISLSQKISGSSSKPEDFITGLVPNDGDRWNFDEAIVGESYEIQAKLVVDGQEVSYSSPVVATVPARREMLTLNIESQAPVQQQNAVISGNILVNGYIPDGAVISVRGRSLGEAQFEDIAKNLPGQPRQFLSYANAIGGVTYEVVGTLFAKDQSTILGTSSTLTVTAPAVNETLIINSTAIAPFTPTPLPTTTPAPNTSQTQVTSTPTPIPQKAVISGSIKFNGVAPANSRIVVLQKAYNSSSYQVAVDNITPVDGATWQWGKPAHSTWYDLVAVLKQRQSDGSDRDVATSSMQSLAAPATSVQFTLNSGVTLSAPSGSIGVSCGNESGSSWNATITFDGVSGAKSYWYQIGTSNGGIQVANSTQNSSGGNLAVNTSMINGTIYYTRYAYANLTNLNAGSDQFSPFSSTKQIKCGS